MVKNLNIWLLFLRASLASQLSYRPSFFVEMIGRSSLAFTELVVVFTLFSHVQALAGWSKWEVVYLYGVASSAMSIARFVSDGLRDMETLIRHGTLDGILIRPAAALTQIMGRRCSPHLAVRSLQAFAVVGFALHHLNWQATPLAVFMLMINISMTALIFLAIFVVEGASQIYTIESREAFSAFTHGGVQMVQYPLSVYPSWLRSLFLFGVPLGYTAYLPALVVLNKNDELNFGAIAPYFAPLVAFSFLGIALAWWSYAIDHYRSTGS